MTREQQYTVLKLLAAASLELEAAADQLTPDEHRAACLDVARARVNHCRHVVAHQEVTP